MEYDRDKLYKEALQHIEEQNLFFAADVYAYLGISHDSFYRFWPTGSERYETIKRKLEKNKQRTKVSIRSKLYKGDSTAALIALYKLIGTKDEVNRLSGNTKESDMTEYIKKLTNALQPIPEAKESD